MVTTRVEILQSRNGLPVGIWSVVAYQALNRDGYPTPVSGDAMAQTYALGGGPSLWNIRNFHRN